MNSKGESKTASGGHEREAVGYLRPIVHWKTLDILDLRLTVVVGCKKMAVAIRYRINKGLDLPGKILFPTAALFIYVGQNILAMSGMEAMHDSILHSNQGIMRLLI